ncbi:MAG: 50S ribosomal protein L4 [Thermoanaerobaculia bacterium]|nr:50S ribosomal protein L4 [Thermoanaerobaculia bacterium]
MKIAVKSLGKKKKVRDLELPEEVFGYPYNEHLILAAVKAYRAAQRAGTHKVKTRKEIKASGRKPWRQKGTGRARAGSASSPLWRGGGTVHGPQPRDYAMGLSAREKRNALKSALARKLADEELVVVDSLELGSYKTGALDRAVADLGVAGKTLLGDGLDNENLALASRNNPRLKTVDALGVNVYDVVGRSRVVFSESALGRLIEVLSK